MFDDQFEVVLADSQAARRISYQLRYQVYCLEEGFEDHKNFPNGEESDEWDKHSVHFLVRTKQKNEWVAAMRLVLQNEMGFPMENVCKASPSYTALPAVEVSRLCILDRHRRFNQRSSGSKLDTGSIPRIAPETTPPNIKRLHKSEVVMGLMRAAAVYCREREIPNWYFLSTSAFARMMSHLGFQLTRLGPSCQHRGERFPFLIDHVNAYNSAIKGLSPMTKMLKTTCAYSRFSELDLSTSYPVREESLVA